MVVSLEQTPPQLSERKGNRKKRKHAETIEMLSRLPIAKPIGWHCAALLASSAAKEHNRLTKGGLACRSKGLPSPPLYVAAMAVETNRCALLPLNLVG